MDTALAPFASSESSASASSASSESSASEVARRTRPHALAKLVRSDGTIDWSPWYLTDEEDMGQSGEQGRIIATLRSSLQVLAGEREWSSVLVASDNFFAWVEGEPFVQVSPDVYLLDYPEPGRTPAQMMEEPLPTRWQPWRPEHAPPRLAIEIVSADWKKDYEINPPRYDHLGVSELVLADPEAFVRDLSAAGRAPLSIYRRTAEDRLELAYRGPGPVQCAEIDAYLCVRPSALGAPEVRISRDADGTDLVPTTWQEAATARQEAATARRRAADAEQEATTARQKAADAEQEATTATQKAADAEERAATLAAEIASLRARLRERDDS